MPVEVNAPATKTAPQPAPLGLVRAAALAAIGLISLIGDELEAAYERGVQRERQRGAVHPERGSGVSQRVLDEWAATLSKLNLPTKSEIDALSRQITALQNQVDQIAAQKGKQ